jgi:hypothetical protein
LRRITGFTHQAWFILAAAGLLDILRPQEDIQKHDQNHYQEKIVDNINPVEKSDEENHQFMYNLNINSSELCKKCDVKRKTFKSNNVFHIHTRDGEQDRHLAQCMNCAIQHDSNQTEGNEKRCGAAIR